jgi:hypothetical protein
MIGFFVEPQQQLRRPAGIGEHFHVQKHVFFNCRSIKNAENAVADVKISKFLGSTPRDPPSGRGS